MEFNVKIMLEYYETNQITFLLRINQYTGVLVFFNFYATYEEKLI